MKSFTKLTVLYSYDFGGCVSLTSVNLDNILDMNGYVFERTPNTPLHFILPNIKRIRAYFMLQNTGHNATTPASIVVLGKSLTTSHYRSFRQSGGKKFFFYAENPPAKDSTDNYDAYSSIITMYVRDEYYDNYINNGEWSTWVSKTKKMSEYTGDRYWEELYPEELGLV